MAHVCAMQALLVQIVPLTGVRINAMEIVVRMGHVSTRRVYVIQDGWVLTAMINGSLPTAYAP